MPTRPVLDVVAEAVTACARCRRRVLVAVDGAGAVGKTTFTAALADRLTDLPVVVLHVDDFFHPEEVRHRRGRHSAEGFWQDAFDYRTLEKVALDPLRRGEALFRPTLRGARLSATERCAVLVEGVFLLRRRLTRHWDLSVHLLASEDVIARRMTSRGTVRSADDPRLEQYLGAQRLYVAEAGPETTASIVIENSEPDRPSITALRV